MTTRIDLIRHGEPEGGRRYRGHGVDDPLSARGWEQMWKAVEALDSWDLVISSPMRRCREFAQALAERRGIEWRTEPDFKEVGFGVWEGRAHEELPAGEHAAFLADPVHRRPPGAESLEAFAARVRSSFDAWCARSTGQRVLIVAHAGVIRAVVGHVLRADPMAWYRLRVNYAALSRIRVGNEGPVLVRHNCRLNASGQDVGERLP